MNQSVALFRIVTLRKASEISLSILLKLVFAACCFLSTQMSIALASINARIVIHPVTVKSIDKDGHIVNFEPTDIVDVINTYGNNYLIKIVKIHNSNYTNGAILIPSEYLAGISSFKPLNIWHGVKKFEITAGDYSGTYYFKPNGTFKLVHSVSIPDNSLVGYHYEQVTNFGRLHKAGRVIWARLDGVTSSNIENQGFNMFWLKQDSTLCYPPLATCKK